MIRYFSSLHVRLLLLVAKILFVAKHKIPFPLWLAKAADRFSLYVKQKSLDFAAQLKPMEIISEETSFEIHSLVCKRDLKMYLWAIRSLLYYTKLNCPVVVHDDGTLNEADYQLLKQSLPGVKIIPREVADCIIAQKLKDFPRCQQYRENSAFGLKLFNLMLLPEVDTILSFDSDILFFRYPRELIQKNRDQAGIIYNKEYTIPSYGTDSVLVEKYHNIVDGFNSGLVIYPNFKDYFVLSEVENIVDWLLNNETRIQFRIGEQIVHAILMRNYRSYPLSPAYSAASGSSIFREGLVCKHYHSIAKEGFWLEGIAALLQTAPDLV